MTTPPRTPGDTGAELFRATGESVFGRRWHAEIGRFLGLSRGYISELAAGVKILPPKHHPALAELCRRWLADVDERRARVEALEKAWRERGG